MTRSAVVLFFAVLTGCGVVAPGVDGGADTLDGGAIDGGASDGGASDGGTDAGHGLPRVHPLDATAAQRGEAFLLQHRVGGGLVPLLAMRNLWLVWGGGAPASDAAYWALFRERYGLIDGGPQGLPLGFHVTASQEVALDCLTCHAGEIAGQRYVGAPNARFDLQGLFDDLVALAQLAPMYGFPATPPPWTISGRTQAAGANDAMGLGLSLARRWAPGVTIDDTQGFQRSPAWWTLAHKQWHYLDGSGPSGAYRAMMATLLASRLTLTELQAQDADFADLAQYLLSLEAPRWPFAPPDAALAAEGQVVFAARCAECHGTYDGAQRSFPDRVVALAEVGTDAVRASSFTTTEAGFVNASWFGADAPMRATGGYLAPDLSGVWATAPYLHNGSVPTLAALLDSSRRPGSFRLGTSYDEVAVGWQWTSAQPAGQATLQARKTYDTAAPGLSNAGHTFGDALDAQQRRAVLEYLKTM